MSEKAPVAAEAATRLRQLELLLDRVLDDLSGKSCGAPCSGSPGLLAEASGELQFLTLLLADWRVGHKVSNESGAIEYLALRPRIEELIPRISRIQRLLTGAAEFYRGWCAAGPPASYPLPGYQTEQWTRTPALLAFEG